MPDPQAKVLDLIFGRWRSQILYAGVKLGIFDALRNGGRDASAIAHDLRLDSSLTYRLMRALGSLDLLTEDTEKKFSLTEAGERLCSDHAQTLRGVTLLEEGQEHYAIWKHLPEMGVSSWRSILISGERYWSGRTSSRIAPGCGHSAWE